MIKIKDLKIMNETTIIYLKKLGKDTRKNEIINNILEDESCFFKIQKDEALDILKTIGVGENKLNSVYAELTSAEQYYKLKQDGDIEDGEAVIDVTHSGYVDVFKEKREKC